MDKADALMRRRRSFVAGSTQAPAPEEDVPVLTEVVDPGAVAGALPQGVEAPAAGAEDSGAQESAQRVREMLAPLPPDIARAVESWLAATLPRLVAHRLDGVAEQVAQEVGAELRETLPLLIADLVRNAAARGEDPE